MFSPAFSGLSWPSAQWRSQFSRVHRTLCQTVPERHWDRSFTSSPRHEKNKLSHVVQSSSHPSPPVSTALRPRAPRLAVNAANADASVRINKCFKAEYSRREADSLVASGRVRINGEVAGPGARVRPGDRVTLDDRVMQWERLCLVNERDQFSYIKFHKPVGIITTTDAEIENNIVAELKHNGYKGIDRVFPIGRLDEQSSGIILFTSDGSLVNAVVGKSSDTTKVYVVRTDRRVSDDDMERLRRGVVIKTIAQHPGRRKPLIAKTLPCEVERCRTPRGSTAEKSANHTWSDDGRTIGNNWIRISLKQGRNRQIRRMLGAVGDYTVRAIHRESVMGISLAGIEHPGQWAALSADEMDLVRSVLSTVAS